METLNEAKGFGGEFLEKGSDFIKEKSPLPTEMTEKAIEGGGALLGSVLGSSGANELMGKASDFIKEKSPLPPEMTEKAIEGGGALLGNVLGSSGANELMGKASDFIKEKSPLPPEMMEKAMGGLKSLTSGEKASNVYEMVDLDKGETEIEETTTTVHKEEKEKGGFIQMAMQVVVMLIIIPLLGMNSKILQQTRNDDMLSNETMNETQETLLNEISSNILQILSSNNLTTNGSSVGGLEGVEQSSLLLQESISKILRSARDASRKAENVQSLVARHSYQLQNNSMSLDEVISSIDGMTAQLGDVLSTLSVTGDNTTLVSNTVDELRDSVNELLELQNPLMTFISCKDIKAMQPESLSGRYQFKDYTVYCNMEELCGSGGGWTRLAYLNMTNSTQSCPSGFRLYQSGGVRACGRPATTGPSCASVQFPSNGISYSQICGRVVGYQYGSPDAIGSVHPSNKSNLNAPYVDGVSITRGSPRKHVWTLMAGVSEIVPGDDSCPCSNMTNVQVQSFIGNGYYCESGNPNSQSSATLYTNDPLWDGERCGGFEDDCCTAPSLPWFHRDYGTNTTIDYIELRVCGDEGTGTEGNPVGFYEIYVM